MKQVTQSPLCDNGGLLLVLRLQSVKKGWTNEHGDGLDSIKSIVLTKKSNLAHKRWCLIDFDSWTWL